MRPLERALKVTSVRDCLRQRLLPSRATAAGVGGDEEGDAGKVHPIVRLVESACGGIVTLVHATEVRRFVRMYRVLESESMREGGYMPLER